VVMDAGKEGPVVLAVEKKVRWKEREKRAEAVLLRRGDTAGRKEGPNQRKGQP